MVEHATFLAPQFPGGRARDSGDEDYIVGGDTEPNQHQPPDQRSEFGSRTPNQPIEPTDRIAGPSRGESSLERGPAIGVLERGEFALGALCHTRERSDEDTERLTSLSFERENRNLTAFDEGQLFERGGDILSIDVPPIENDLVFRAAGDVEQSRFIEQA